MKKSKNHPKMMTTEAFKALKDDNIKIGFRYGVANNRQGLKGNRCQKSKHRMRSNMGMKKTNS